MLFEILFHEDSQTNHLKVDIRYRRLPNLFSLGGHMRKCSVCENWIQTSVVQATYIVPGQSGGEKII
jgi:hypothetical protein